MFNDVAWCRMFLLEWSDHMALNWSQRWCFVIKMEETGLWRFLLEQTVVLSSPVGGATFGGSRNWRLETNVYLSLSLAEGIWAKKWRCKLFAKWRLASSNTFVIIGNITWLRVQELDFVLTLNSGVILLTEALYIAADQYLHIDFICDCTLLNFELTWIWKFLDGLQFPFCFPKKTISWLNLYSWYLGFSRFDPNFQAQP